MTPEQKLVFHASWNLCKTSQKLQEAIEQMHGALEEYFDVTDEEIWEATGEVRTDDE